MDELLIKIAGFLALVERGFVVPDPAEQTVALLQMMRERLGGPGAHVPDSLSDVELALQLHTESTRLAGYVGELLLEAGKRAAWTAAAGEQVSVIEAHNRRVEFSRPIHPPADAPSEELVVVEGLEVGEYRAVDRWGEFVVVHRTS